MVLCKGTLEDIKVYVSYKIAIDDPDTDMSLYNFNNVLVCFCKSEGRN